MYYTGSNQSPSHIMQLPGTGAPQQQQQQQQQHFPPMPSYPPQQSYIMQQSQQNCDTYPQQNTQFVPMNAPPQSHHGYLSVPNNSMYNQQQQQPPPNQPPYGGFRQSNNKSQMVPIPSDDERYHKQLIVNYLAPEVTGAQLHSLFSRFGPLDGARIIYDRQTNMPRGYGFVYFHFPENAKEAVEKMNGFEYHGKRLKVGYSTNPLNIISRAPPASYPQPGIQ